MKSLEIRRVVISICAIACALPVGALVVLRVLGLIGIYSIPTASMAPAVAAGDCIFEEGMSYHFRKPERGEIIVFHTRNVDPSHPDETYIKRVIGLPGETLRFSGGKLYVNDKAVEVANRAGAIDFTETLEYSNLADGKSVTVPAGSYFVVGDNLARSADSRIWGPVPVGDIRGRAVFCYWPGKDVGPVK